jgi:hypothetical protein
MSSTLTNLLPPASRAGDLGLALDPGVALRFTPGFMLPPAPQARRALQKWRELFHDSF